ncbi:MAG: cytochrome BD ubiquinol oxidase subunit I [Actinobacteria bacterium RBG_16_68_21]|nr:MAG: cytochrome BD ubiquinol oxidase subunit I [Actinobacteria bacterium RBG_16_68_21]
MAMAIVGFLAEAASGGDLLAARQQMALSLGWHIVVASFGVAFPIFILLAEWRGTRGDEDAMELARRWSKTFAVLFAVGAVSGTILSFELGMLWPGMVGTFGDVWGLPFAIEGVAFFLEAIFLGIYLYGWDRFSAKAHLAVGLPIPVAGAASAFIVVTANAWMNHPTGFDAATYAATGRVIAVDPWAAMFNRGTPVQGIHMILAALMVGGFAVSSVYAWAWLRGRRDRRHQLGFVIPFVVGLAAAPVQVVVGDWAARFAYNHQPIKFAALEAVYETEAGAPLSIGGWVSGEQVRFALEIPGALSWLATGDRDAVVVGLGGVPPDERPPVPVVRMAFQVMVGIGFLLVLAGAWFGVAWWRRRSPPVSRWFWRLAWVAGPLAAVALEAGWVVTELGRQPWIVYQVMRIEEAVTPAPGIRVGFWVVTVAYTALTAATVFVLTRLGRSLRTLDVGGGDG